MAKEDNLKVLSSEEARKNGRKGGIASGKARREKKMFRETLEALLSMPLNDGKSSDIEKIQNFASLKKQNISVQEAILIAQIQRAMKGDTRSAEYVRDTIGQRPTENMNMTVDMPVFFEGEDALEE